MLSKSQISFVKSLHHKKFRKEQRLFIVEGIKSVSEYIHSKYLIRELFFTEDANLKLANLSQILKVNQITRQELSRISTLSTPQNVLALVQLPDDKDIESTNFANDFTLALDGIQDPGNLGTIIRSADWFGINTIVCSNNCVDLYNPKVVQSTMGSIFHVKTIYTDLHAFIAANKHICVAATLDGQQVYGFQFDKQGILVIGSESHGISASILSLIQHKITIPSFGKAESLNAGVATSILLSLLANK